MQGVPKQEHTTDPVYAYPTPTPAPNTALERTAHLAGVLRCMQHRRGGAAAHLGRSASNSGQAVILLQGGEHARAIYV